MIMRAKRSLASAKRAPAKRSHSLRLFIYIPSMYIFSY